MRELSDVHKAHSEAVNDCGFKWCDGTKVASALYSGCFERRKFKMLQEGSTNKYE
jgi:hypothetical protein